jgi:hypothetical protein
MTELKGAVYSGQKAWGPPALDYEGRIFTPTTKEMCVEACEKSQHCAAWIFAIEGAPDAEQVTVETDDPIVVVDRNAVDRNDSPVKCLLLDVEHRDTAPVNFATQLMASGRCDPSESSFSVRHLSEPQDTTLGIVYADKHRCYKLQDQKECYCECYVKSHKHSGL